MAQCRHCDIMMNTPESLMDIYYDLHEKCSNILTYAVNSYIYQCDNVLKCAIDESLYTLMDYYYETYGDHLYYYLKPYNTVMYKPVSTLLGGEYNTIWGLSKLVSKAFNKRELGDYTLDNINTVHNVNIFDYVLSKYIFKERTIYSDDMG